MERNNEARVRADFIQVILGERAYGLILARIFNRAAVNCREQAITLKCLAQRHDECNGDVSTTIQVSLSKIDHFSSSDCPIISAMRDAKPTLKQIQAIPLSNMDEVVVNSKRWICYLFSLLRIHSPNCEHCNIRDTHWVEVKKRLEALR